MKFCFQESKKFKFFKLLKTIIMFIMIHCIIIAIFFLLSIHLETVLHFYIRRTDNIKIKKLSIININTHLLQNIVIKQIQNDASFTFKEMRALSFRRV